MTAPAPRRPHGRSRRSLVGLVGALSLLAACNDDGRTLAPAPSTTAVPATTGTSVGGADESEVMRLTSPDLAEGELIGQRFTCDGLNVSPTLVFDGTPPEAAELAVAVVDLDAGGYVHWVVAGLAPTTVQLAPGEVPAGAVLGRTDSGVVGWDGPCPPPGDEPHRYEFRLYAAAEPIGLAPGLDGREAIEVLEAAAIEVARLTARYGATEPR